MTKPVESAFLPREFKFWPDGLEASTPQEIHKLYEQGYAGAFKDPVAEQQLSEFVQRHGGTLDGNAIAEANGLYGAGEGRLVLLYPVVEKYFPGCFPGAAQQVGDCVSHSTFKACMGTAAGDIDSGKPDEVSGKIEGPPEITEEGLRQGAFSSEAVYWYRGYNGDGWSCEAAARVACENSALWPRINYPDLGIDLTRYSGSQAHKYGSKAPPSAFTDAGRKHLLRTATKLNSFEQLRDFLANGYGVSSCGGEGWSSRRDANGYSKRQGSWSHAFPVFGTDDRDIAKQEYGDSLVLSSNNWGPWNSGGTRIMGTELDIPPGFWWTTWKEFRNRTLIAFAGASGWPARKLKSIVLSVG